MKIPMLPPVVAAAVPVFCVGAKGILKIAFWLVATEGLLKNGPVGYAGTPVV